MSDRPWIVLKYGGTSVSTAARWEKIVARIEELSPTHRVWVVVSALAGVTNRLERVIDEALAGKGLESLDGVLADHTRLAGEAGLGEEVLKPVEGLLDQVHKWLEGIALTQEAPPRVRARVLAAGELASSRLGAAILNERGVAARWVDARELLTSAPRIRETDDARYLAAWVPTQRDPERGARAAAGSNVVITQGFVARTPDEETCILGRGGSDTSAALFGALLGAETVEIWTDVHGLFTADPALVPEARLIRKIGYREAEELAALGGKVLHPRSLGPVAEAKIPMWVRCVDAPDGPGTLVEASAEDHPVVTAVTCRLGVTLITLSSIAMLQTPGYLAGVFAVFDDLGFSIDMVGTSETAITVTLDRFPGGVRSRPFSELVRRLGEMGKVAVIHPCGTVSIVGRRIRAVLHQIGPTLEVFQERPVHLVSDSSADLDISFVLDEVDAPAMVTELHARLFSVWGEDPQLGPTWEMLRGAEAPAKDAIPWWRSRAEKLAALAADGRARYVYHLETIAEAAGRLRRELRSVSAFYYSVKANVHPEVLETIEENGFGFECVSAEEVLRVREVLGPHAPILFTPNFCPAEEYARALVHGAEIVVDGPQVFDLAPDLFAGSSVGVRIDPGRGLGHHLKVVTAGAATKFGLAVDEVPAFAEEARKRGVRVIGIHAHRGSGILDPNAWPAAGGVLASVLPHFPEAAWLDLGGGLGVPEHPGQKPLDLRRLEEGLAALRETLGGIALRLEPGRYLVSEAGVLIAPVTQVRHKGAIHFAGVATGMNSLIRPALYGAHHRIHNLSRLDEPAERYWQIVGPICESADVLGRDRWIPDPRPGDVILIENAGAYGAVMASRYNLREPAEEVVLD